MAFSMLMIIPPALLYICCSKYITEGIKTSGMKD
jgi:multiple sugar transport system permease protein